MLASNKCQSDWNPTEFVSIFSKHKIKSNIVIVKQQLLREDEVYNELNRSTIKL